MAKGMRLFVAALLGLFAGLAGAQEEITYHGCVDAGGRAVPSVKDPAAVAVVETVVMAGIPTIRYNPDVLPRLQPATRLFLYAHECARHNLGLARASVPTREEARRADCWGAATLIRSGLVEAGQVDDIERDLAFSPEEWRLVPGPARSFALGACPDEMAAKLSLTAASPQQPDWNSCVRRCGESLRACQRSCQGPGCAPCERTYGQCSAGCDTAFPR